MQVDHIDRVDEPGGAERIAQSLAAYWQSIYRCTHTTDNTDYTKIAADYPDDMRLTAAECEGLGADFTVTEVLAAIKGLSVNKSTHGIVAEVFKGAAAELAPMLCAQLSHLCHRETPRNDAGMTHKMNLKVQRHGDTFEGPRGCTSADDSEWPCATECNRC